MIFYNGGNGGLGRYFGETADKTNETVYPLASRLEDGAGLREELKSARKLVQDPSATLLLFAAKVSVPWCESHPSETHQTNVIDTVNSVKIFLAFCKSEKLNPQVIYVSSAHLYARNDSAIHETHPVKPRSVYARSKLDAENALRGLSEVEKFDLRIARVFGLVAPVQPENYILHAMLKRAREKRLEGVPGLANLRDYLDSRDVCRALLNIANAPTENYARVAPDRILNIASGSGRSIRSILGLALHAYYPAEEVKALLPKVSEAPPRADDVPNIIGSVDRYLALFGEKPGHIALEETVREAVAQALTSRS
jgi:nucleoside-diphosphate-sugar epimerase